MPWRMIGLVLLLVLVAAFATLNLSNRTDVSLGFHVFRDVPIFMSLFVAFLAGILAMVPYTIAQGRRGRRTRAVGAGRPEVRGKLRTPEEPAEVEGKEPAVQTPARAARGKGKSAGSAKTRAE